MRPPKEFENHTMHWIKCGTKLRVWEWVPSTETWFKPGSKHPIIPGSAPVKTTSYYAPAYPPEKSVA